jgi:acyl carrier protein
MSNVKVVAARIANRLRDVLFLDIQDSNYDLVNAEVIDSSGFLELFALLEKEFGISVGLEDMDVNNFRTIENMASFVINKQNASGN